MTEKEKEWIASVLATLSYQDRMIILASLKAYLNESGGQK